MKLFTLTLAAGTAGQNKIVFVKSNFYQVSLISESNGADTLRVQILDLPEKIVGLACLHHLTMTKRKFLKHWPLRPVCWTKAHA
jgi:hypothetical protein